jgi:hypothetical protein
VDVDENSEATLIHDYTRHQNTQQLFIMNLEGTENPLFVVRFLFWCILFFYRFMVFQVCNSMKMNFCIGFGDGAGLLLQVSWLLNEECRSHCESLDGGKES